MTQPSIRLAVLTGGHAFDVPNFHRLFRGLDGIDGYVQTMEDFAAAPQATRDAYDVVLFYHMLKGSPQDASHTMPPALEHLKQTGQGLVVMHHALLAFAGWPEWRALSGINPLLRSYQHDQTLAVHLADPGHPLLANLSDFELVDETYEMDEPDEDNQVLLTTDHPASVHALAWARRYGGSRVFALALGHDQQCWGSRPFQTLLRQGILWTVKK